MRINTTEQKLQLIIKAMNDQIVPNLQSESAQASAGIICETLTDLLKRETVTVEMLRDCIDEGEGIAESIAAALGVARERHKLDGTESACFPQLSEVHSVLTEEMTNLGRQLLTAGNDSLETLGLLESATQWELSYYARQAALAAPIPEEPTDRGVPLDQSILQDYLRSTLGDASIEVSGFEPLPGGFGKQTYFCNYSTADNAGDSLVIRKTDPSPIMKHGACNLRNEFDLLTTLAAADYPAPKPIDFCDDFANVDGTFYTMGRIEGSVPGSFLGGAGSDVNEALCLELAELLGKLHSIPLEHFGEYIKTYEDPVILTGTTEDCYRHNLRQWVDYMRLEESLSSPCLIWLVAWLEANVPQDPRSPVLVHGDYNYHNILAKDGKVIAILDWECAGFGCPEQDLAYIKPHITEAIDWDVFLDRYYEHGGRELNPNVMSFAMAYASLRTNIAANRATLNLQTGTNLDVRYTMVEQGFTGFFINAALESAASD